MQDLLIIGGGINGCSIARDAAGRGLSVTLCEQHDLGAHTSSASTKLIHGGLRYLEYGEFALVRKALQEREILLAAAPHIMHPLRFVLPHDRGQRPAWLIRLGLWLYDHLARRRVLPASQRIRLAQHQAGEPLQDGFRQAFVYSDGWVDDARMVVLNALAASELGANILPRTPCLSAQREDGYWRCQLGGDTPHTIKARLLVNAGGPWVQQLLDGVIAAPARKHIRLVKGSHIIVPRLFSHNYAYIFQNPDRRIIFALPYEHDFTLIGTTDTDFQGDAAKAGIDAAETAYLCAMANRYFRRQISPADVVASFSGVRPLLDDEHESARSVSRDYALESDCQGAPLLSVYGGKITTSRKLAEQVVDQLQAWLGQRPAPWTAGSPLPGGDLPDADFDGFLQHLRRDYPWLPARLSERIARAYGSRTRRWLGDSQSLAALGEEVLPGLFAAEIDYLRNNEWAGCAEDMLQRRSKLYLHLPANAGRILDDWLHAHPPAPRINQTESSS